MGWVSQATEKVGGAVGGGLNAPLGELTAAFNTDNSGLLGGISNALTGALQPIEKGINQGVADVTKDISRELTKAAKTISNSPFLEAAIVTIAAANGVPPEITSAFLASNKYSQTGGNLEKAVETLVLSYGAGKLMTTGIDLNAAEAAAAGGGGDAAIVDAALGGTGAGGAAGAPSILTAGSAPGALAATVPAYLAAPSAEVLAGAALLGGTAAAAGTGAGAGAGAGGLAAYGPALVTGALQTLGAANTAEKAREAAQTQAAAQVEAARIAAEAAKFRPVGVTTRFGTSQFTTDAQGNVIGAGYTASPEIKAYQNRLSALAAQGLTGAEGAQAAYAPLTAGAQSLFNLGQGYIQQTPEQQAAAYIAKQQALLAPGQEQQLAQLQNKLFQQGRGGATVAQGGNLMATNPELAAYYNAIAQSNLQLAAQGQQAGQQQAQFGAGLLGAGSDLMGKYYAGQVGAYAPFATAIDTTSGLENLAQQPMTLGTQIGAKTTASAAEAGRLLGQGMINSAATQAPANAFSYSGNLFNQAANNPVLQAALNKAFST